MLGNKHFYNKTIKKMVALFGTLFNEVYLQRDIDGEETQVIKVPLTYAPKERMLARFQEDPSITRPFAALLPTMSFEMMSYEYDSSRKLATTNFRATTTSADGSTRSKVYAPVPWNIDFNLYVYSKNAEDGAQIIEQILPFFTPDWTVTAVLVTEPEIKHDIPVILKSVMLQDTYEDNWKSRRAIVWTLSFTMKTYVYGPTRDKPLIRFTKTNLYSVKNDVEDAVGVLDPVAIISGQPGLLANGSPTSNSSLSIPVLEIDPDSDWGYSVTIEEPNTP